MTSKLLNIKNALNAGISIFDMKLSVTFYARVSTDKDEQLNSLDNQVCYFKSFIEGNPNWVYVDGYIDEGISGKSAENRASFMRMIRNAQDGMFDLIITKEISRFSRNTLDSIKYTQQLLDCGVGVYFQSDNINTLMPDSDLRLTIMASIAQEEVRKLSERLRFGYKRAIEKGRVLGQDNLIGYDKKDCVLTINEDEAAIVRRIFEIYIEGKLGIRAIARQLEKEGIVGPESGEMLSYGTMKGIITNPKYKGYYCSRKTVSIDFRNNKPIHQDPSQWIIYKDDTIPPIVSEEVWDLANALYRERGENAKAHSQASQNRYPFSGKLVCAEHGTCYHRHVYSSKKNGDQEVWNCKMYRLKGRKDGCESPTVYTHELQAILNNVYKTLYENKDAVIEGLLDLYSGVGETNYLKDMEKTQKELSQLERKKEKLWELLLEGFVSKKDFQVQNDKLLVQIEPLQKRIAEAQKAIDAEKLKEQRLIILRKELELEYENTEDSPFGQNNAFLDKIIVHKIDGDKRHVRLEIFLTIGRKYTAEIDRNAENAPFISLYEIGIWHSEMISIFTRWKDAYKGSFFFTYETSVVIS